MMTRRKIIVAVIALGLLVTAFATNGFGLFGRNDNSGALTLYGNVDIREVDLAFDAPGRIDGIEVEEGERVEEGALLATLDRNRAQDRLNQSDAQIAEARANLAKLANGSRPQEIAQARARLAAAQAQLADARSDHDRRASLVDEGAISRDQWEQTVATFRRAQAEVSDASASLSLVSAGARSEDVAAARARLRAAEASRDSASTDLEELQLFAPTAGTIVTRAAEPGSIAQPGQNVLTLSIDRPMRVRAYVGEPDLPHVAPGMKVKVSVDGRDEAYDGTIGYISPSAEFTPKSVETESLRTDLVYRLRITVTNPNRALRQGQPVTVIVPDARTSGTSEWAKSSPRPTASSNVSTG